MSAEFAHDDAVADYLASLRIKTGDAVYVRETDAKTLYGTAGEDFTIFSNKEERQTQMDKVRINISGKIHRVPKARLTRGKISVSQ